MLGFRRSAVSFLLISMAATANAAIFVVTHPDDDILFMGKNLGTDIMANHPTVIIVVTAGDGGNGESSKAYPDPYPYFNNMGQSYYRVRMNAREAGLDTWIRSNYPRPWVHAEVNFGAGYPRVEKASLGNVIEYRLNIPDNHVANDAPYNRTYLQKMLDDAAFTVRDIRQSNTYTGPTLRKLIRKIAKLHFPNEPTISINYQNPVSDNVDHPDHTAVARHVKLALDEKQAFKCMRQVLYDGYGINKKPANETGFVDHQRRAYEALNYTLRAQGNLTDVHVSNIHGSANTPAGWAHTYVVVQPTAFKPGSQRGALDTTHTSWYGRQYYSTIVSTGFCNLARVAP
jgi:LmbE family N-acetylglucosaminyl deacetylase